MLWLFGKLAPFKGRVVIALLALVISAFSWLVLGQGVRIVVDQGLVADDTRALDTMMLVVLGITMVGSIAAYVRMYLTFWLGERVSADIRTEVYAHLLTLSPGFFEKTRTGEVISRFTSDTTVLQTVIGIGLSMLLRASITFVGAVALMLFTSPLLTLYVLIAVPIVLLPIRWIGPRVRRFSRLSQDRVADMGAYVDESLHEINTVQAYTHEQLDRRLFDDRVEAVMDAASQRIRYRALLFATIMSISIGAITVVAWLGARDVLAGGLSAGELTAFMFYAVMAGAAVATISEVIGEVQKAAGASERLRELLDTHSNVAEVSDPRLLPVTVRGELTFDKLSFSYPAAPDQAVLQDISLQVSPGERVALVGPSGAGKSTLFQLLLRFYDPQCGRILIDDIPVDELSLQQLRTQYAMVPQESVIFAASALENIRYGRPDAAPEEVRRAAVAARADEFIRALPEGYDTDLGERGVRLSGGQKQRISIARAILADRPILLLDEATSSLDASNERQVKLALDELMQGKTTLIIAHRLATVINADRIVVIDNGRIIDIGKHDSLVATNQLYKEFAELQLVS
ncbi:MAG: ABC transporter transmembrane domain-containing protein [Gammaproteobacteria bacterium]|nr:ABC transporter transmembrane domain-containing protein [Gammaproteobacteria bacterium]